MDTLLVPARELGKAGVDTGAYEVNSRESNFNQALSTLRELNTLK